MSSSRSRGIVALAALGGLMAAGAPALALDANDVAVEVTFEQANTVRQFYVRNLADDEDFRNIAFDAEDRAEAFRTVVEDTNRLIDSGGYEVNARMTDLYLVDPAATNGYDFNVAVPSRDISLSYGANPLRAISSLPVVAQVDVSGTIGTCSDGGVAGLLGITALPAITDVAAYTTALAALVDPQVKTLCTALGTSATTPVDIVVDAVQKPVAEADLNELIANADLPFALTGAQQTGPFTHPSYEGTIASLHPTPGGDTPTSKRIMTGTPAASNLTATLLATLDTALDTAFANAPDVGVANEGLTNLEALRTGLAAQLSSLATALAPLDDAVEASLLERLDFVRLPVDINALTTTTASYIGYPVLQIAPTVSRAGIYKGTLIVDFFDVDSNT